MLNLWLREYVIITGTQNRVRNCCVSPHMKDPSEVWGTIPTLISETRKNISPITFSYFLPMLTLSKSWAVVSFLKHSHKEHKYISLFLRGKLISFFPDTKQPLSMVCFQPLIHFCLWYQQSVNKGSSMWDGRKRKAHEQWCVWTQMWPPLPQPSTAHQFKKDKFLTPFLRTRCPKTWTIRPHATLTISPALILATSQPHWTPWRPPSSSQTSTHPARSGWNDMTLINVHSCQAPTSQALIKCHSPYEIFHQTKNKHSCVPRQGSESEFNYNYLNVTLFPLRNYKLCEGRDHIIFAYLCLYSLWPAQCLHMQGLYIFA